MRTFYSLLVLLLAGSITYAQSVSPYASNKGTPTLLMKGEDAYRFPLFLEHQHNNAIKLCGLIPGEEYVVYVNDQLMDGTLNETELIATAQAVVRPIASRPETYLLRATNDCAYLSLSLHRWDQRSLLRRTYLSVQRKNVKQKIVKSIPSSIGNQATNAESLPNIVIDPTSNCPELVEEVFVGGDCYEVTNISQIGPDQAMGIFTSGMASLDIEKGVILSSGNASDAQGPNISESTSAALSSPGDVDLTNIAGANTSDAVGFEFDFLPTDSIITFEYSFASEEYCEYVNAGFNDPFGFFLSGPGINGPYANNAINIALLPNGDPVTIDNVNHMVNSGYFNRNSAAAGDVCEGVAFTEFIEYDGFTVRLTATANVIPCEQYHLKLVVADAGDSNWDSAVFLKSNSFVADDLVSIQGNYTIETGDVLYEGCGQRRLVFRRQNSQDLNSAIPVNYTIDPASTATSGVDYTALPSPLEIPVGQDSIVIFIDAFEDNIEEGTEYVIINIENSCQCNGLSDTIYIEDLPPIDPTPQGDTICASGNATISVDPGGGVPDLMYVWSNGQTTPSITVSPTQTTTYTVTITDLCGQSAIEEVEVISNPLPTATSDLLGSTILCNGNLNSDIEVFFTGEPPFTLRYSINGNEYTIPGITDNPFIYTAFSPGNHVFISVVDAFGCENDINDSYDFEFVELTLQQVIENPDCPEAENGLVSVFSPNGMAPFDFVWNNGAMNSTLTDIGEGEYCVTVTDANNCTVDECITIEANDPLEVDIQLLQEVNCQNTDGRLLARVTNSHGQPVSYEWSNGSTGGAITDLSAGTYTITVQTPAGCRAFDTVTLVAPESFELTLTPDGSINCAHPNDGSITLATTGGQSPFSYFWNDGSTQANRTGLTEGIYIVSVVDDNDCRQIDTVTLAGDFEVPVVNIHSPDTLNCSVSEVALHGYGSSADGDVIYEWSNLGGVINGYIDDSTALAGSGGFYTLTATDTSSQCTATFTVSVIDDSILPEVDAGEDGLLNCEIQGLVLMGDGQGTSGNLGFQWVASAGGNIVSGSNTLNPTINAAGTYTLTVIDSANHCRQSDEVAVEIDTLPPLSNAGEPATLFCNSNTIFLDGSASSTGSEFEYAWTTINGNIVSGANTAIVEVDRHGIYYLEVRNTLNGCSDLDSTQVNLSAEIPFVDAGADGLYTCRDTVFILDGTATDTGPTITYEWTSTDGNIVSGATTLTPTVNAPGTYILSVYNSANGCRNSDDLVIDTDTIAPTSIANSFEILTCSRQSVQLDGSGSSFGAEYLYEWTTLDGEIIDGADGLTPTVNRAGIYQLLVRNLDNGCEAIAQTTQVEDVQYPTADIALADTLNCEISEVTLSSNASVGSRYTYQWTGDGSSHLLSGEDTPNAVVDGAGSYYFVVTDTVNDCATFDTVSVAIDTVSPMADAGPTDTVNCYSPQVNIGGNSSSGSHFLYEWTTTDGHFVSSRDSAIAIVDSAGIYTLRIFNTNNGCESTAFTTILSDFAYPIAEAGNNAELNCVITELTLQGAGSSTGLLFRYEWEELSTGDGIVSGVNTLTPLINEPGIYELTVLNEQNGCTSSDQVNITQDENLPTANAGPDRRLTCDTVRIELDGSASSNSPTISYAWSTSGTGNILSGQYTEVVEVDAPGTYVLTVFDSANNCEVTSTAVVLQDTVTPVPVIAEAPELNCALRSIELDGSASDLGSNMVYQWRTEEGNIVHGSNLLTPQINAPGVYTLLISNVDNGCRDSAIITVMQDTTSPVVVLSSPDEITCAMPMVSIQGIGSSVGNAYTYQWLTQTGTISSDPQSLNVNVTGPGVYRLIIQDSTNQCSTTDSVLVIENTDSPLLELSVSDVLNCEVTEIELHVDAHTSNGDSIYLTWTIEDSGITIGQTPAVSVSKPGLYRVRVIDAINSCASEDVIEVFQDTASPVATLQSPDTLTCSNRSEILLSTNVSSGPEFSYQWSTTDGNFVSASDILQPEVDAPGTYELMVSNDSNRCTFVTSVFVPQDVQHPVVDVGADEILDCIITSLEIVPTVSTGGAFMYAWSSTDGTLQSDPSDVNLQTTTPGTYVLRVLNTHNGCETADTLHIDQNIEPPTPIVEIIGDPIITCDIKEIVLDGAGSSGQGVLSFDWSTSDGNIVLGNADDNVLATLAGVYLLIVTDSENGCTASTSVSIAQDEAVPSVVIAEPELLTCALREISLNASGSSQGNGFEAIWQATNGGMIISGDSTYAPVIGNTGTYQLTIYNVINGCDAFKTIEVEEDVVSPNAVANSPQLLDCEVKEVEVNGMGSSAGPQFSYQWLTQNGVIVSSANDLIATVAQVGTYYLAVLNSENGCTDTAQTVVRRDPNTPQGTDAHVFQPQCTGEAARLSVFNVIGGTPPYLYSLNNSPFEHKVHYHNLMPGNHLLRIIDSKGCEFEQTFTVVDPPDFSVLLPDELNLTLGKEDLQIIATIAPELPPQSQILWNPLSYLEFRGDTLAPYLTGLLPNSLSYRLTVIDSFGCEKYDDVTVNIEKPKDFYVPNIFTPNGDDHNDNLIIVAGPTVKQVRSFLLFDRWGERIYEIRDFDPQQFTPSDGWDGTFMGNKLNPAVYVYYAEVEYIDGSVIFYEGDVTLVR